MLSSAALHGVALRRGLALGVDMRRWELISVLAILSFCSGALAVDVIMDTDETPITGANKTGWLDLVSDIWVDAEVGQLLTFSCTRRDSATRCHYTEYRDMSAAQFSAAEIAPGVSVSVAPHRVALSGSTAHVHKSYHGTRLDSSQEATFDALALSTFGVTSGACTRAVFEQEGGELIGHACRVVTVTDGERLQCLKLQTCRRPPG